MADSAIVRSIASANQQIASPPFDPAEWLARYRQLGGRTRIQDGKLWLHWSLKTSLDRMMAIKAHVDKVTNDEAKATAVRAIATAQGRA